MAERRATFSRLNMHFGEIITSTTDLAQIGAIELPKLGDKFNLLRAEDIPGLNAMSAFGTTMPLLAAHKITYLDQPIMVIMGPDYESVTIAIRDTRIQYAEAEMVNPLISRLLPEDKSLQWGNIETLLEKSDLKKYETVYTQNSFKTSNYNYLTATAWQENGYVHIEIPCQWPELLKRTVADAISFPLKNVVIHPLNYSAPNDEYLFNSIVLGALASVACVKTNLPVELRTKIKNASSAYTVKRTTYATNDGKLLGEDVTMSVDIGAFPFGAEEYQRQALTGLIPNYSLQAFRANVVINPSTQSPRGFFGSLGYSEALCATEYHLNHISTIFDINPLEFRKNFFPTERRFTDYIPSFDLAPLKRLTENVCEESKYLRKWISYSLQKGDLSLLSFTRGIGLASGVGVSGFSTTYAQSTNFQAKLTLTEKNNLTINSSFPARGDNREEIWRDIALEEMELSDASSVIFLDFDSNTINSGPDILNSPLSKFSKQIISGCRKLVHMAKTEAKPFSILIDVDNKLFPCEFENLGNAAIIVELVIDKISFTPIVKEVWAHFRVGSIHNKKALIGQLKEELIRTLDQCGASFSQDSNKPFAINITLTSDKTDNICDMKAAIQGLTKSAYYQALKQALGKNIPPLPIKASRIEHLIGKGEKK